MFGWLNVRNKCLNPQEEYDDEEEAADEDAKTSVNSKFEHALEEEDPEVIKELITLIKKVGGLDELEKQLQMRLSLNQKSSIVGVNGKTTTTVSPISQSLYNKVLGTRNGLLRENKVVSSTQSTVEIQPLVQRQNKENRYSAVIRNSRPRPQNDGLDQLPETEGGALPRERPQYTTITRTQAPKPQKSEDENEQSATVATNEDDDETTTHQPSHQYVSIQRLRPSTSAAPVTEEQDGEVEEVEEDDDEEEEEVPARVVPTTTPRMQYVNIQRVRPTKPQYISDDVESESPVPETKYEWFWMLFYGPGNKQIFFVFVRF